MSFQTSLHLLINTHEISAGTIHFINKSKTRNLVFISLAPYSFGLWLHSANCTEYGASSVQDAQRPFHLDSEINVPRSVDDINAMIGITAVHPFPEACGGGRSDGNTALLLLLHPIHRGRAVMHFTKLM